MTAILLANRSWTLTPRVSVNSFSDGGRGEAGRDPGGLDSVEGRVTGSAPSPEDVEAESIEVRSVSRD